VSFHSVLLATRQKVVEPKHVDIHDEQDEARPHDQQPETRDREKQILRMANSLVKSLCCLEKESLLKVLFNVAKSPLGGTLKFLGSILTQLAISALLSA
jgi:hypothetical protein